jgi:hypothetical protein
MFRNMTGSLLEIDHSSPPAKGAINSLSNALLVPTTS